MNLRRLQLVLSMISSEMTEEIANEIVQNDDVVQYCIQIVKSAKIESNPINPMVISMIEQSIREKASTKPYSFINSMN